MGVSEPGKGVWARDGGWRVHSPGVKDVDWAGRRGACRELASRAGWPSLSSPAQTGRETVSAEGPLGLEITAPGDLGKNSLCGVTEGELALQWVGSEWEVKTRMKGVNNSFKTPSFAREKDRDREREQHARDHTRKTLPQNHALGKGELTTISFYKHQSSKSEVLEVHTITRALPGGLNCNPVGKESRGPGVGSVVLGSLGSHGKKKFPYL